MAAEDRATLGEDPFQRVWFLCTGSPTPPLTQDMIDAEIEIENTLTCTEEMSFKGLCCAPWVDGLNFSVKATLGLKGEQVVDDGAGLVQSAEPVIKLCTEQSAGEVLAEGQAARLPVECISSDFTEAELLGDGDIKPGEVILRARLLFFQKQGIEMDAIPKCSSEVQECPDGNAPVTVSEDWIKEQEEQADGALLQEAAIVHGSQSKHARRVGRRVKRGAASLSTTGSFTLSAGGGSDK